MPFNTDRKRLFVGTIERAVENYQSAKTDTGREKAIVEALVVRDKFDEEDYPEISSCTEQPLAIVTLGEEYTKFLAAMGQHRYADTYKALRAVASIIESFQA